MSSDVMRMPLICYHIIGAVESISLTTWLRPQTQTQSHCHMCLLPPHRPPTNRPPTQHTHPAAAPDNNTYCHESPGFYFFARRVRYSVRPSCTHQPFIPHTQCAPASNTRRKQIYIYAKMADYFSPEKRAFPPHVFARLSAALGIDFVVGVQEADTVLLAGVANLGGMGPARFYEAVARSWVLMGMGAPSTSPTLYGTLHPANRTKWVAQHEHLGPPHVYNIFKDNADGLKRAVRAALAAPLHDRYILPRMELAAVQARVGAVLETDWRGAAEAVLAARVQAAAEKGPGASGDGEETEDEPAKVRDVFCIFSISIRPGWKGCRDAHNSCTTPIAAKIEPLEQDELDGHNATPDATQNQEGAPAAANGPNSLPGPARTTPDPSIATLSAPHPDAGNATASADSGGTTVDERNATPASDRTLPDPTGASLSASHPELGHSAGDAGTSRARAIYMEEIRQLSDDDDDELELPALERMISETRPDYDSQKKTQEPVPPRSSTNIPVKSEPGVSNHAPSRDPIVIDLIDSPLHSPQPQKPPPATQPSPSQVPTKRKHTPSSSALPSDIGSPPAKRSKIVPAAAPAHKHAVHWVLDGNIVLQIQDVKFKLHKSHLVKHSPWFAGLFDGASVTGGDYVARGEDGNILMYILSLPELTAKDFARLLDAFDNAITYVHQDPFFQRTVSILRAATLLSFPDFRDWAVRLLEDMWSPALANLSTEEIQHATESVLLARECELPAVLKRALYELVRLAGYGQSGREGVSPQDFRALVKAREHLTAAWMQTMNPYSLDLMVCARSASAAGDAEAPPPRYDHRPAALVHASGIAEDYLYDPLCGLHALIEADWAAEGYCDACVKLRREVWANRREKIWDNLDIWLGLN
ncbi:hypothetical protein DFH08DRAFT_1071651 [Mycena albidolilacea]|uniref:BTB domain-containing protein n=1 Tax=Mycena albidolilacea TaxID=1033008 RepID=A0AAD7AWF4_9AGAR|nr:hypothetical protein DFH08DRAFT_1071651 [Mycena albidolilacea]